MTPFMPKGYSSLTSYLNQKDTQKAIEFYKKAFGAVVVHTTPGLNGKGIMHAELKIGNAMVMMGDESPQHETKSAETIGDSPVSFYIYVENADAAYKKAIAAGGVAKMPVQDMFWGDRIGSLKDPFGYSWSLATHQKDVTPEEVAKAAKEFYAQAAK